MSLIQSISPDIEELKDLEEDVIEDLAMFAYCNPEDNYIRLVKKEMKNREKLIDFLDIFYESNKNVKIFCDAYDALKQMIEENDFSDAEYWHQALVCSEPNPDYDGM